MADLEAKALDKETLDEIKSELEETKKIIKGIGIHGPGIHRTVYHSDRSVVSMWFFDPWQRQNN